MLNRGIKRITLKWTHKIRRPSSRKILLLREVLGEKNARIYHQTWCITFTLNILQPRYSISLLLWRTFNPSLVTFHVRRETKKRAFAARYSRHFFVTRATLWTHSERIPFSDGSPFYILSARTEETKFTVKRFEACAFLSP